MELDLGGFDPYTPATQFLENAIRCFKLMQTSALR